MAGQRTVRGSRLRVVRIDGSSVSVGLPSRDRAPRCIDVAGIAGSSRELSVGGVDAGPWWWRGFLAASCAAGRVFELIERV